MQHTSSRAAALVAALLTLAPALARADAFEDQLDQARKDYGAGDIATAISDLELSLQELKGKLGQAYLATFPAPAAGWTYEDDQDATNAAAAVPFLGGGPMVKRTYRSSAAGGASIDAQIMTGGSLMQGLAAMFMNPAMLAAQPGAKRVRIGKDNAVVTYDPQARTGQLMLDVLGKASILLDGKQLDSGDALVDLATRWDLKKVKEIAGL